MRKAMIIGVLAEIALLIFAASMHTTAPKLASNSIVMRAELIKPAEPPKPIPPPPEIKHQVQKIVSHQPVISPPKPQPPEPAPQTAPVIPMAQTPAPMAPAVATSQAPTPVAPSKPVASSAPVQIGVVCPVQTRPEMPEIAESENISGSVTARATIRHGKIVRVDILKSNPKGIFDQAVRQAMLHYQCESNTEDDVVAEQTFKFTRSD